MHDNIDFMAKTKLLLVSTEMHIGGVTKALTSLLAALDPNLFDIDLLLYESDGPLQFTIPPHVRVLPNANAPLTAVQKLKKFTSPSYVAGRAQAFWIGKIQKRALEELQIRSRVGSRYSRRLYEEYDIAISFIEFWPLYYTAFYVNARHKLAWIHIDYKNCTLSPKRDAMAFKHMDRVVMVSEECLRNFRALCPAHASRAVYMPNILSTQVVRAQAAAEQAPAFEDGAKLRLMSVCRIELAHKGLDRGIEAFSRLRDRDMIKGLHWYIIGDGDDRPKLERLIEESHFEDQIHLLGPRINPLPYLLQADAFFLPSRYEGKPIAVTEAMMLGIPAIVTAYASAPEQIENGVDGMIVENSTDGIVEGLSALIEHPAVLTAMRNVTSSREYGNTGDIGLYYQLFSDLEGKEHG